LDQYFLGQYEQAINLWTRVLFLDRHHDRARAYIDRARSAQAELQRESEAVLHQGIVAFQAGDVANARRLIADALVRGAPRDDAQGMLDRIERLGAGQTAPLPRRLDSPTVSSPDSPTAAPAQYPGRVRSLGAALLLVVAALGVVAVALWGLTLPDPSMLPFFGAASLGDGRASVTPQPAPLPQASANETYLARSRALAATGRLRDALHEIDRIPLGDPLRADADRLRSEIQRQFLAIAAAELPGAKAQTEPAQRPPE
jgi:tetratricopeptide (TPR) repeat protein